MPEGTQRCSRTRMVLPLRVSLNKPGSETLVTQLAHTVDISHIGCRLGGLRMELSPGQTIALQRGQHKASFRVIWSRRLAANENQAGIEALDYGSHIWAVELPPSPFAPESTPESTRAATPKFIPLDVRSNLRWGLSLGLLCLVLGLGFSRYRETFAESGRPAIRTVPASLSAGDLARLMPPPRIMLASSTKALDSSAPRIQVAETPIGHVAYPVAPDDGIRGRVRLQIIIAADGAVKKIRALSGKQPLAEAAAEAVRLWRYSSFPGVERFAERETSVTVSFVGGDAVSLEFPSSTAQVHAN